MVSLDGSIKKKKQRLDRSLDLSQLLKRYRVIKKRMCYWKLTLLGGQSTGKKMKSTDTKVQKATVSWKLEQAICAKYLAFTS